MWGARWLTLLSVSGSIFYPVVQVLLASDIKNLIDLVGMAPDPRQVAVNGVRIMAIVLGGALVSQTVSCIRQVALTGVRMRFRRAIVNGVIHGHNSRVSSLSSGDVINRVFSDVDSLMNNVIVNITSDVVSLVARATLSFAYMYSLDARLALVSLVSGPGAVGVALLFRKPVANAAQRDAAERSNQMALVKEIVSGLSAIRTNRLEHFFDAKHADGLKRWFAVLRSRVVIGHVTGTVSMISQTLSVYLVLVLGAYWASTGQMSVGSLMAFAMLAGNLVSPLNQFGPQVLRFREGTVAVRRVLEVVDINVLLGDQRVDSEINQLERFDIRIERLTFGYSEDKDVLVEFSLQVPEATFVVITGPNGSGKSTLLNILVGEIDGYSGQVLIGDQNIRGLQRGVMSRAITIVEQRPFLFSGTIRENLLAGSHRGTDADLFDALDKVGMKDFVGSLPNGLDSSLREEGLNLSDGQKQRFALARVLLRDSRIILLDEPTSSVDQNTAYLIGELLSDMANEGKIVVCATHDQRLFRGAHRIVELDNGRMKHDRVLRQPAGGTALDISS